eukprot:GHVL01044386.1.p1 GENE.GHVL01044386.1~~GHVL01044386.1.p1  ORF type:complete len:483 (+),score=76.38 GHVL01044386.1:680-2128(+)
MLIHQNRYKGSVCGAPSKNSIHESFLPPFLDLVIWGHEHECIIDPQESAKASFHIIQPGSSVATSLIQAEAVQKHIALLEVKEDNFRVKPILLGSVRPFMHGEISLSSTGVTPGNEDMIYQVLAEKVNDLIDQSKLEIERRKKWIAKTKESRHANCHGPDILERPDIVNMLPLIRLKVEHLGYQIVSPQRFGHGFIGRVANPTDIIAFYKRKKMISREGATGVPDIEVQDAGVEIDESESPGVQIQDIIFKCIGHKKGLEVLPEPDFNVAVQQYVHRLDAGAIERFISQSLIQCQKEVKEQLAERYRGGRNAAVDNDEIRIMAAERTEKIRQLRMDLGDIEPEFVPLPDEEDTSFKKDDTMDSFKAEKVGRTSSTASRSRGSAKAKPKAKGKARGGKGRQTTLSVKTEEKEDLVILSEDEEAFPHDISGTHQKTKIGSKSVKSSDSFDSFLYTGSERVNKRVLSPSSQIDDTTNISRKWARK